MAAIGGYYLLKEIADSSSDEYIASDRRFRYQEYGNPRSNYSKETHVHIHNHATTVSCYDALTCAYEQGYRDAQRNR